MAAISDVRDLSALAYGFMASKVLFAALNAKLFDALAEGPRSFDGLVTATGVAEHRLETLLTACVSVGLVERRDEEFVNGPASEHYLVSFQGSATEYTERARPFSCHRNLFSIPV